MSKDEKPFSVLTTFRPRRVAFLFDPVNSDADRVLDAIADFNCDTWGGSYNPIIPVSDGKVSTAFWQLLEAADPDIIYSYAEIESSEVRKLDSSFVPTKIMRHRYGEDKTEYAVWIQGQASIEQEILKLKTRRGARTPGVIMWSKPIDKDRFIRRNFGISATAGALAAHGYLAPSPATLTRTELCAGITKRAFVSPRFLSSLAPVKREFASGPMHFFEFLVCYGDNPWNFLNFWNEAFRHGFPDRRISNWIEEAWIPDEMAEQKSIQPLIQLINARLPHLPHDSPLNIRIVSYDHSESDLSVLAGLIKTGCNGPVSFENTVRTRGFFEGGTLVPFRPLNPTDPPQHDQARGSHFFIPVADRTSSLETDEVWMSDLKMQSTDDLTSSASWWIFPRRSRVAELLHDLTPSRVTSEGTLSVEVSNRSKEIDVTLPGDMELFAALVTPRMRYSNSTDLRYPLVDHPPETFIAISDKGKYTDGVVRLFESLSQAGYWIDNRFWRELLKEYSSPRDSEHAVSKLRKDIAKSAADFIKQYEARRDEAISWLADKMLRSLANIPQIRETFTYEDLSERWKKHLSLLDPHERQVAEMESIDDPLSVFCSRNVLMQGCRIRCKHCLSVYWYHVDDLKVEFPCQGCRERIRLPIEPAWAYQLNDLVRAAIREHGVGPVIRTEYRLMKESKGSFKLLTGVEMHEMVDEDTELIGELDLCWIADGRFGIAEIKSSAGDFTATECQRLVTLAKRVLPDEVLLAAVAGADSIVGSAASAVRQQLDGIAVRCFLPSSFNS